MNSSVTLVRAWHAVLALVVAAALVLQLGVTLDAGRSVVNLFSYFTIQSNVWVLVAAVLLVLRPDRDEPWFQAVRMAGLVGITVTGVVYALVLAGDLEPTGLEAWLDVAFHRVSPVMAVLGFVLLRPRTPLGRPAWWFLAWAVAWLAYTLLRAEIADPSFPLTESTTGPVPYPFLDAGENGWGAVVLACVVITGVALALAAFYRWVARRA